MAMRRLVTGISVAIVVLLLEVPGFAQGCAMCRAALEQSAEGRFVASSFAHGIIMMLVLPYALLGIFGVIIYRAYRKKSKASQER
jgi:hypothetical protein